jgi:multidrug efflux pump subunit AcrB
MLVDNGIVIVENIYRHMQQGKSRQEAARVGADQVAWPVITSTLTTLGAFSPMMFWPGIMGEFMGYLPMTLIMALTASLFVALIINPVLSARYQRVKPLKSNKSRPNTKEPVVKRAYLSVLNWCLGHRLLVMLVSFVMLIAALTAFSLFGKGTEFFPETEPKRAYINIKAPEGTNLDTSDKLVSQAEKIVSEYEDIRYVISNIGAMGGDPFSQGGSGTHISRLVLDFKDFHDRSRLSSGIVNEVRDRILDTIKGAEVQVEKEEEGPPTGMPISIEITGEDILKLGELAGRVRKIISDIPGLVDLKDNFVKGKPEIQVRVDKEKSALMGLDTYTIAYTVKAAINGAKAGVYREGKDEYDIVARLPERDRRSIESLKRITVSGPRGEPIPLTTLAQVELGSGIGAIMRLNQKRVVTITGDVSGRLANDVIKEIDARLQQHMTWPRGYAYRFSGEQEEQAKAQSFLSKAFFACIAIILLILLTQFNSFITPFIILTCVILSLVGVFIGLLVTGTAFGIIMTGIGVISLAGVVVNNAIVLIDYYNQLLDKGLQSYDALIRAGSVRFRPVMLTAVTTILGLLPMATGVSFDFRKLALDIGGESSQWWGPMAVAVIFGLGFATLLTLIVVPVLCSLVHSAKTRKVRIRQKHRKLKTA